MRALGARFGSIADVVAAYTYAIEQYGARIVNLSLSGSSYSQLNALGLCRYPNVLFVAAAGNDSRDVDAQPTYPCAYDLPNLLCVGATDERDDLASFSNHGPATVEIGAPGVSILSTGFGASTQTYSGTSQATPMVAAAAALVLQRAPGLTAAELKDAAAAHGRPRPGTRVRRSRRGGDSTPAVRSRRSRRRMMRDVRVELRNGKPTLLGTLVTDGPTTLYVLHGNAGAHEPAQQRGPRSATRSTSRSSSPARPGPTTYRLVADNARGHYASIGAHPRPRSRGSRCRPAGRATADRQRRR